MSIELLLLAAEYIDRRERESEHGYACVPAVSIGTRSRHNSIHQRPASSSSSSSSSSSLLGSNKKHRLKRLSSHSSSSAGASRSAHNELEKNRRAQMRFCMEQLKKVVPLGSDSSKHTTLGLLTKARRLIKSLQDESNYLVRIVQLERQSERSLRKQLRQVYEDNVSRYWCRSDEGSESSSSSSSSPLTLLSCPASENEPIDVVGYGKKKPGRLDSTSDGDDRSEGSSDSGCVLSPTTRLAYDAL